MLLDYKLSDPITRLTLLIANNPQPSQLNPDKTINTKTIPKTDNRLDLYLKLSWNMQQLNYKYISARSELKQQEYRHVIYIMAYLINCTYHLTDIDNITNWTGEYYPDLNSGVINPHQNELYYIQDISDQTKDKTFKIYRVPYEHSDKLLAKILNQSRNLQFKPNYMAFNALKNFWFAQSNSKFNKHLPIPKVLNQILTHIIANNANQSHTTKVLAAKITYEKLLTFYQEVQNHHITDRTKDVQNWLFSDTTTTSDVTDILKILELHPNYQTFVNSIENPLTNTEKTTIIDQLKKDPKFPKLADTQITIYPINQPIKSYRAQNSNVKHFTGIHGTNAFSIPTILCDGLKSAHELHHDNDAHYAETAQALGDGTYFARLDQASKALNYANDKYQRAYLLIADVSYANSITVTDYGYTNDKQYDFIMAPKVGIRSGYDEYVAVHPQKQVDLKFLVEITPMP